MSADKKCELCTWKQENAKARDHIVSLYKAKCKIESIKDSVIRYSDKDYRVIDILSKWFAFRDTFKERKAGTQDEIKMFDKTYDYICFRCSDKDKNKRFGFSSHSMCPTCLSYYHYHCKEVREDGDMVDGCNEEVCACPDSLDQITCCHKTF